MKVVSYLMALVFPYSHEFMKLKEEYHKQKRQAAVNDRRVDRMYAIATLNGEDGWMLKMTHPDKEVDHNG